jgi:hypothetical protein
LRGIKEYFSKNPPVARRINSWRTCQYMGWKAGSSDPSNTHKLLAIIFVLPGR